MRAPFAAAEIEHALNRFAYLTLRSARSARLEGWATHMVLVPTLRDAALVYPEALEGAAPQGEAFRCSDSKCIGKTLGERSMSHGAGEGMRKYRRVISTTSPGLKGFDSNGTA